MNHDELSDYNDPQEVPGVSEQDSKVIRFHACLDELMEKLRGEEDDELYAVAVLEGLAAGCQKMGLTQEFAARMARFQKVLDFPTMIERTFLPAKETPDDAPFLLLVEIMGVIAQKYTELKVTNGSIAALGKVLRSMGYEHKKITRGASYRIVMRSEEKE